MYKTIGFILLLLTFTIGSKSIAADPEGLIKATGENEAKCVEYYIYKGELFCSTEALAPQTVDPSLKDQEKLNIVFDDRPWQLAWGEVGENGTTIEYVPKGENINDWNELITSQYFPGLQQKVTLKELADTMINNLEEKGFNPVVKFYENTDSRVIFEFRIEQPKNQIQDELQMLTQDENGIYILHYVIKKSDMGEKDRNLWIQRLKESGIKK